MSAARPTGNVPWPPRWHVLAGSTRWSTTPASPAPSGCGWTRVDCDDAMFDEVLRVNTRGVYLGLKHGARHEVARAPCARHRRQPRHRPRQRRNAGARRGGRGPVCTRRGRRARGRGCSARSRCQGASVRHDCALSAASVRPQCGPIAASARPRTRSRRGDFVLFNICRKSGRMAGSGREIKWRGTMALTPEADPAARPLTRCTCWLY